MTDKQKRFCEEYVVDNNIAKASLRAGYKDTEFARQAGWENMQLYECQLYIEQLQAEAAERCQISKDEWLLEFKKIGFSNIRNYMEDNLDAKDLSDVINPEVIKSVKKTVKSTENGTDVTIEFTLHDKQTALVNIGRHLGWFEKDNAQKGVNLKGAKITFK